MTPISTETLRTAPLVIFDGDCGFCAVSAQWLAARLRRGGGSDANLVPWQFTDLTALGTTAERAQQEVLWVGRDGRLLGGAAACAAWLRHPGGAYGGAGRLLDAPGVRVVASAIYRMIARNRQRMPGSTAACALPSPRQSR